MQDPPLLLPALLAVCNFYPVGACQVIIGACSPLIVQTQAIIAIRLDHHTSIVGRYHFPFLIVIRLIIFQIRGPHPGPIDKITSHYSPQPIVPYINFR
ncbi:hypothetical protein DP49_5314 [Burkholderia pseudomallei]|nr:hypothetical protein DO73_4634 [Burkholderia pseudomallei]KGD58127.1 hypothetical protein DP49_5314 [Burkholderia pseudomallei]